MRPTPFPKRPAPGPDSAGARVGGSGPYLLPNLGSPGGYPSKALRDPGGYALGRIPEVCESFHPQSFAGKFFPT